MESYEEYLNLSSTNSDGFSASIAALLVCVEAESYIPLFKEGNIGLKLLREFNEFDLILLGVNCSSTRTRILDAINQLPQSAIYNSTKDEIQTLSKTDITTILIDSKKHLNMIYLSLLSNRFSLMKTLNPEDVILNSTPQVHSSDVVLKVYENMDEIICKMEQELNQIRNLAPSTAAKNRKRRKILMSSIGSALIMVLSIAFVKSLKT